ncbi:MAG: hypothetical protein OXH90_03595 [Paracoccaceae bacterium]|nr:hypothetical protein [Paracoccaceae bacterium]MDE2916914.1 hypothetical protein [Paracoccaceae bacterium]
MNKNERFTKYCDKMQDMVFRLQVVETLLKDENHLINGQPKVECVYLQLRLVLERIATASLVVNEKANSRLLDDVRRKWHSGDILGAVESINPHFYYPRPLREAAEFQGGDLVCLMEERLVYLRDMGGDYLTRENFTTLYNQCGSILHTPNPLDGNANSRDNENDLKLLVQADKWRKRIIRLLNTHEFRFGDKEDKYYLCFLITDKKTGKFFNVAEFEVV